jgi:hypothetical protein
MMHGHKGIGIHLKPVSVAAPGNANTYFKVLPAVRWFFIVTLTHSWKMFGHLPHMPAEVLDAQTLQAFSHLHQ